MNPWEKSGAMPMPKQNLENIFRLGSQVVLRSCDGVIAGAPMHVVRGINRLGLSGTLEGSTKQQVLIEPFIAPREVVSCRLELEDGVMGRPIIGYDGLTASSFFGDKFSKDSNFRSINGSVYKEGYGILSFEREDGSLKIVNDLSAKDVSAFIGTCLAIVRHKNSV